MSKAKQMTKGQIVGYLAEKNQITKKQITEILDSLVCLAYKKPRRDLSFLASASWSSWTGRQEWDGIRPPAKQSRSRPRRFSVPHCEGRQG